MLQGGLGIIAAPWDFEIEFWKFRRDRAEFDLGVRGGETRTGRQHWRAVQAGAATAAEYRDGVGASWRSDRRHDHDETGIGIICPREQARYNLPPGSLSMHR